MDLIARIAALRAGYPQNLALKHFDANWFGGLSEKDRQAFALRIRSGVENPDSEMGCYALEAEDYERFAPFFDRVIADHHGVDPAEVQAGVSQKETDGISTAPQKTDTYSKRIRIARNLAGFPLPGGMTSKQRSALESAVAAAIVELPGAFEHFSLTPGHPCAISEATYEKLISEHLFFKPMNADPYLASAGIAGDWPKGRAAFVSFDKSTILWVNEEDHLRLMVMDKQLRLPELLVRLQTLESAVAKAMEARFAQNTRLGFVTSCPTNIGTGMRASVHVPLPALLESEGTDGLKHRAAALGLAVRGVGGEHTQASSDGIVDLSPSARLGLSAADIIARLQAGIEALLKAERAL